jgi:hypothetical protein
MKVPVASAVHATQLRGPEHIRMTYIRELHMIFYFYDDLLLSVCLLSFSDFQNKQEAHKSLSVHR